MIGFAAETAEASSRTPGASCERKGCDWIVANDVSPGTGVMGGDRNTVHLVTAERRRGLADASTRTTVAARAGAAHRRERSARTAMHDRQPSDCRGCRMPTGLPLPAYAERTAPPASICSPRVAEPMRR